VDFAVTIAHPPTISNDFIMELAMENPRFLPVVNIPRGTPKPGQTLKRFVQRGAKAVKIHPASDGEGVESPRYRALIKAAAELGIPVILHTGCIHAPYLYKDPNQGGAELFSRWFETYKEVKFVLAHMNFHDPNTAFDLCEEFPQLYVDTSWQPAEAIGEAARRIGADRVLFASDWPLVGDNIRIARKRVDECFEIGLLNQEQTRLILGENAAKLLGIPLNAL
jgi:predicted TIM-barrel fold metal-dependent hydrolase